MERFFKRKSSSTSDSNSRESSKVNVTSKIQHSSSTFPTPINVVNMNDLPWDPSDRPRILHYNANQRDEIRRAYWLRGPCQPRGHDFPKTIIGNKPRRFIEAWFDQYGNWLEYSVKTDRAFCLCCYLCRDHVAYQCGNDAFVTEGFNGWNKTERLSSHVGDVNSFHNRALKKCEDLMRQKQSITVALDKQSDIVKKEYRIRLNATIDACRYLLKCALPFRGHIEKDDSIFKGNFLELLDVLVSQNEDILKVTLRNAPGNYQMVAPCIHKDVATCFEEEIVKSIFKEIGNDVFALLVDESSDSSKKEQLAIVLRYVDTCGLVKERFVGLVHVMYTSSSSLKTSIDSFFAKHKLSWNRVRGQGYDGASNMYHHNVRNDEDFANLNGIADLSRVMVETRKHLSYPLVYRLLKLTLVLLVATATVERCFSAMKLVKTDLRNKIGDDFLGSCLMCAVEKEMLNKVSNEDVIKRFQKMNKRKGQI